MELNNKTLLLIGGGAYAKDIYKYKQQMGFKVVTVGLAADPRTVSFADKHIYVDRLDIEAVSNVILNEKVDGIFVGSSENYVSVAIEVAEKTGINFYVNREQWSIVSNKAVFKENARKYGFPVIPEFHMSAQPSTEEIESLPYPIMIKPVDSSGARGMNPCYRASDFRVLYNEALKWSASKTIIIEKLIENAQEVFVNYTIQNGNPVLSYSFDKIKVPTDDKNILVPLFHQYPSKYINQYIMQVDEIAKKMIKGIGLQNGTLTLQGFYKNGEFFFFEAGFRMGGAQAYIFTDYNNGANVLNYMINYSLTGKMFNRDLTKVEDVHFKSPCCNYYVALKSGIIKEIEGLEKIKNKQCVLNVTEFCKKGTIIENTNALERIGFRIHVVGESIENLANNVSSISKMLKILSNNNCDMQMKPLTYKECLKLLKQQ